MTNSVPLNGTINFQLERVNSPNSGRIAAPSVNVNGAIINVTNVGPDLVTGDSFQLFSVPISGTPAAVNLPVQNQIATISYVWTNKLAIDGTIQVLSGASAVSTSPTNITLAFAGNTLDLSWPADHIGWTLQTNSVGITSPNSWFPLASSTATNHIIITPNPANTNVFYRLTYQ